MDLVMFVLSVIGLCAGIVIASVGVSMLRHRNGNSVSTSTSKPPLTKAENGKHDILGMCKEIETKLSSDEPTELVVVPERAEGEQV